MSNVFQEQLLLFLKKDLQDKKVLQGWDERLDPAVQSFSDQLSRSLRGAVPFSLEQLIRERQNLLTSRPIDPEPYLFRFFPHLKVLRGIPRLYDRADPSRSKVDPHFTNIRFLKRILALRALYGLYEQMPLPKDVHLVFSGPPYLCSVANEHIYNAFPYLKGEIREQESDHLILEVDHQRITLYGAGPAPQEHKMGFHFLDCGMFYTSQAIPSGDSFFADLRTVRGVFVYFHALLELLKDEERDIEVCVPHFEACARYFEGRERPFAHDFGIKTLVLEVSGMVATKTIRATGKVLRIVSPKSTTERYQDFFSCGDESSLGRALSDHKLFFLNFPDSKKSMFKDLLAIAENRLSQYPAALKLLRIYGELFDEEDEQEWKDDLWGDHSFDLLEASRLVAQAVRCQEAKLGLKKLADILKEEFSCNKFLVNLLQRTVCHQRRPKLAQREGELLERFLNQEISLQVLIQEIQEVLF